MAQIFFFKGKDSMAFLKMYPYISVNVNNHNEADQFKLKFY